MANKPIGAEETLKIAARLLEPDPARPGHNRSVNAVAKLTGHHRNTVTKVADLLEAGDADLVGLLAVSKKDRKLKVTKADGTTRTIGHMAFASKMARRYVAEKRQAKREAVKCTCGKAPGTRGPHKLGCAIRVANDAAKAAKKETKA